jgi:hypothetical protein
MHGGVVAGLGLNTFRFGSESGPDPSCHLEPLYLKDKTTGLRQETGLSNTTGMCRPVAHRLMFLFFLRAPRATKLK